MPKLTPDQARDLHARIRPHLQFVSHLAKRLAANGYKPGDHLLRTSIEAQKIMQDLYNAAHAEETETAATPSANTHSSPSPAPEKPGPLFPGAPQHRID